LKLLLEVAKYGSEEEALPFGLMGDTKEELLAKSKKQRQWVTNSAEA